jgi:hypothetical protein
MKALKISVEDEKPKLGLSREEAEKRLTEFRSVEATILETLLEVKDKYPEEERPKIYEGLLKSLDVVEDSIRNARDWYSLQVSEEVNEFSKKLHGLTQVLVFLTGILALLTLVLLVKTLA